jgi:phosphohistidine phosphatase
MTRQLLILRHGHALADDGAGDAARALSPRGARDAESTGNWLRDERLIPDHVVTSPARRAHSTAELVCRAVRFDAAKMAQDARIYEADPETLIAVLRDAPAGAERVLLVGHNPGLEGLVLALCGVKESLHPGDLAVLGMNAGWAETGAGTAAPQRLVRAGA